MAIGNRVFLKRELPEKNIVEAYKTIPAANICDCMSRLYGVDPEIRLMSNPKDEVMAGVALTVKARAGDNLMIHQALEMAGEGDVIIVSNEGDRSRALIGEVMAEFARCTKKITGYVFDGPIRDVDAISKMDFPIYATGATPAGPYKEGPGEINVPINIGGITVNPGDIIVGDKDGLIAIPKSDARELLKEAVILSQKDSAKVRAAIDGSSNKAWVADKISKIDCEFIDGAYN